MARKSKDRCRHCGDTSAVDPDTWQPIGVCAACSAPKVQITIRERKRKRAEDREVVVKVKVARCDVCNGPVRRWGYRHDSCADLVEQGADTVAMFD